MKEFSIYYHLDRWKSGLCRDADMACIFFLYYHAKKYPNRKLSLALDSSEDFPALLQQFVFKKVKSKALSALKKWCAGEWNLKLVTKILNPLEVLDYQAQGIRPVTLKLQDELSPILHKDDCLEFFLHDLEHGYMFFFDESLKQMQLQFFAKVKASLNSDLWHGYRGDEKFEQRLHYLISDMNTHKEHYRSYLNAMIAKEDEEKFSYLFS